MPCDGKSPNCDRRRELLAQLKCLISSMDRKKPCEWDEPPISPIVCCPAETSLCAPSYCVPVKRCKSFDFRASIMYRCECIRRNGLQDRCMMWDCMGRPECMTKLYPVCEPGRAALLKLTDLGDVKVALRKLFCANQARETALAAYCRLVCDNNRRKRGSSRCVKTCCAPFKCLPMPCARSCASSIDICSIKDPCCKPAPCVPLSSPCQVYVPSPANPTCCTVPEPCCRSPCMEEDPCSPPMCSPCYSPSACLPCCPPPTCLPICPPSLSTCLPCCPPPPPMCLPCCPPSPPTCLPCCPPPTCLPPCPPPVCLPYVPC